ncbi:hypothetical protein M426DRAFT_319362 [Hypoxylon sp. CI-4A]|nr:hypothetical protein M426DRAFT_319362 [Hypoxylon sp. CI-4A]
MKAIVAVEKGKVEVQEVSVPKLRDGYVLAKVKAIGLNPADWKSKDLRAVPGIRMGLDYAGVVEELGNGVTNLKKGDRIAGFLNGGNQLEHEDGAFQEYVVARARIQIKIPDNITDEEAATLGVSTITVGQGLYKNLGLPWPNNPTKEPFPVFIHGGSTATGLYGIQYAKASGLTVITTASPRNFDYLKSLGADAVFDYKSPTCGADIRAFTNNKLKHAWDCTSGGEIVASALTDQDEGKYWSVVPVDSDKVHAINPKVDGPHAHLGYAALGDPYVWFDTYVDANAEEHENGVRFVELASKLLADGTVKPIRTFVNSGGAGLEGAVKGLDELRAGKVSAGKLVYTL